MNIKLLLATVISFALMTANFQTRAGNNSAMPDLVIVNARVRTMDPARPIAETIAIYGDRIMAVGTSKEMRKLAGPGTRLIDAKKQLVLPGFNDAHVHFLSGGFQLSSVDLRDANSPEEFAARMKAFADSRPAGRWVTGGDWDHERGVPDAS